MTVTQELPTANQPEWSSKSTVLFTQYTNGTTPSNEQFEGMVTDLWNNMKMTSGKDRLGDISNDSLTELASRVSSVDSIEAKLNCMIESEIFEQMAYPFPEDAKKEAISETVVNTRALILPTVLNTMQNKREIDGATNLINYSNVTNWMSSNVAALTFGDDYSTILRAKRLTNDNLSPEKNQEVWDARTEISKPLFTLSKEEGRQIIKGLRNEDSAKFNKEVLEIKNNYENWCSETAALLTETDFETSRQILVDSVISGINCWLKKPAVKR